MDTSKTYVATKRDVEALMVDRLKADSVLGSTRNTYLRMVIATAQKRLDINVVRAPRAAIEPTDEVLQAHADMVETVHAEFYDVIKAVATRTPKDADDSRDIDTVIASRLVFARSAYSTIRAWILRGRHSLQSIVAAKAIKREMAELTPPRIPSVPRTLSATPLVRSADAILSKIVTAAATDKEAAVEALQTVINHLLTGFDQLGVSSALAKEAVETTASEFVPLTAPGAAVVTPRSLRTALRRGPVRAPVGTPGAGRAAVL